MGGDARLLVKKSRLFTMRVIWEPDNVSQVIIRQINFLSTRKPGCPGCGRHSRVLLVHGLSLGFSCDFLNSWLQTPDFEL